MTNIILTNNKNLQLVGIRVGVLATLRIELPLVNATATDVEIIVTNATTHTAYLATYDSSAHVWACDISAAQFPQTGKQSYEVAYKLAGKQFWDGKGWIEVVEATTSGISPSPVPPPTRYVCVSVNGYTAHSLEGAIRIPKLFIVSGEPGETSGYIEGDEILDQTTGFRWVLASIASVPTWIQVAVSLANYYTKAQTDEAINALAAYYITANAQGAAFATYAALANAEAYYSGGAVRIPTRNDYAVVLADETHGGAEYRYIYAEPEGGGAGNWEAQYPIETNEYTALQHKPQIGGVELVGNKTLAQLGIASTADATLTALAFSDWRFVEGFQSVELEYHEYSNGQWHFGTDNPENPMSVYITAPADATYLTWTYNDEDWFAERHAIGYNLGSQTDKPLAGEDEAAELRASKYEKPSGGIPASDLASTVQASLGKADTAVQPEQGKGLFSGSYTDLTNKPTLGTAAAKDAPTSGNASSSQVVMGNDTRLGDARTPTAHAASHKTGGTDALTPSDIGAAPLASPAFTGTPTAPTPTAGDSSTKVATTAFVAGALPYDLGTPTAINTASSETVEGETVYYGEATLADHAANIVQVTAATALDELRITFPAATSGKVRDFGLRVEIGTGSAALAAPALVPIAPTGETIKVENNAAEIPALADGTATAKGVTLLYFSETAPGVFIVKGEQVEEVA